VIDELIVTLGLDSRKFSSEVDQTTAKARRAGDASLKQGKDLEEALRKQQNATTSRLQQTEQVSKQTYQSFNRLRLEVLALFSSLATGVGIQQFLKSITSSEASVGRLSKAIGNISTEDVSAFEQASERMGGSAEAAGQSMLGFSQALERMRITGEAAPFMPILRRMHIDLAEANGQARPLMAIMRDISAWMSQHQGPEAQAAGNMLGFDQGTINLLSSGKLEEALQRVKAIGVTNDEDAKRGQAFVETLHDFEQTLTRLGQVLVNDYLPDITKALQGMTAWATANRDWIKADIEEKLTAAIKYVKEFIEAVNEVVKAVGGWQTALEIVFGLWAAAKVAPILSAIGSITTAMVGLKTATLGVSTGTAGLIGSLASIVATLSVLFLSGDTPGGGNQGPKIPDAEMQRRIDAYNREHPDAPIESFGGMMRRMWEGTRRFFGMPSGATDERMSGVRDELSQRLGISPAAASGIVSNLNAESGIQGINEVNPAVPGSRGGFGWAQWTGPRRDAFEAYAAQNHLDPSSDAANMGFLVQELTTKYPQVLAQLRRGDISAREAADIVARGYIIPPSDKVEGHVSDAERISRLHGGDPISKPTMSFTPSSYDPSLGATVPPAASTVSNDNSRTSSTSNETHVGSIVINTAATDTDAIARGVGASLRKYAFVSNANYGLA